MYLKLSFSNFKWVRQAILFLTVLNCVSDSSNFDIAFLSDCTKLFSVFSRCWIGNLMRNSKMYLKLPNCQFLTPSGFDKQFCLWLSYDKLCFWQLKF